MTIIRRARKAWAAQGLVARRWVLGLGAAALVSACVPAGGPSTGGPAVDPGAPVPVALLVPGGSGQASDELLARSLENAARLAISDLSGVRIDLRVYNTAGSPQQAAAQATRAADEGALIILGPVFAQEANAAGIAVAPRGINVLSFSNNTDIAGGNVFVLGPTFRNTARRLASYAVRNGAPRIMIVHDQNAAGEAGRAAIQGAVGSAGGSVVGVAGYEFSQNGITTAAPGIATAARSNGANAIFLTADTAGALPLISQSLIDNGVSRETTRFIGLTRWDVPAESLALPSLQGGLFALPDPALYQQYKSRYRAAFNEDAHPISGLAYDGIAAIGALVRQGNRNALTAGALTQNAGFVGVNGIFRLRPDGSNDRGLAVAQVQNGAAVVLEPSPRSFGGAGF
jgi:ABC-type branched-subunit amino acid transport system substrate-binding protein